jgi:predicted membrane chloride channel (bestrophin family)
MILYNIRSTLGILLRFKGTALAGIGPLWVLVVLNVFESIAFLHYGAPPIEGKTYLDILAKVLVFLLVFRCRLAFDRFWSGRVAVADLGRSCLQMVSDISVFVEQKGEEDTAFCLDLYRRALSTFMCMNIHLRKHHSDLAEIHSVSSEEDDDGWSPDAEARQFTALVKAGLLTKEEKTLFLQNGMAYVTIAATMFSQKLKDGFQMKMMHR